jgi:hypothetical protein
MTKQTTAAEIRKKFKRQRRRRRKKTTVRFKVNKRKKIHSLFLGDC